MIKKYGTYTLILIAGLLLGYLIFGGSNGDDKHGHQEMGESTSFYTCSMHPNIQQAEMGSCPLCGMDLIASNASEGGIAANQFQMTENALALANVETTTVGSGAIGNNMLTLSGQITANEKTNSVQTTVFDGRIIKLNVNYVGEYIKKGQVLGSIYSPELYAAQDKLLTSASYKDSHQKLYDAARNTLGLWKMSDAQIDEVLRTGKPMTDFPIYADVSGTVTEISAKEGNWFKQGDPLFRVSNLYTVWAVFDAYENQLPVLQVGQKVSITSNAFKGEKLEAKIAFIEPILDASRKTVSVRVTLNNKDQLLKPGMFVEGKVEALVEDQVLMAPRSAVLWTGKRSLVYTKPDPNRPIFEMTEVTLGNAVGDSYVILEGLSAGDEIVTHGTFTVDAAAQLQGKKSMMASMDMNHNGHQMDGQKMAINFQGNIKKEFTKVIYTYVDLKDALVATDGKKTADQAKKMLEELDALKIDMLNEASRTHLETIKNSTKRISETSDVSEQRKRFKPLSESMVDIASTFSDLDQPIYVQHCPMADGNKGADWLSLEDKVLNPYFGDKMLSCGSVTKTIQ